MFSPHKFTVPIFNGDQNIPDLIASGIYVVVDEIKLIITAAHMFEQTHFRLGFGFPGETFFTYFAGQRGKTASVMKGRKPSDSPCGVCATRQFRCSRTLAFPMPSLWR